ncbi:PD-(D/E)XK nuclease family protein [Marinomonas balearica]|uniref:PD-(D/E)XK nuclease superfamily protein n=1 Tax=Marinomonas balearica TaxID=491947 RepID=A0A4R6MA17_9GAMM|nr:PD-(D/E)XK nuclease family protein [Marinomonas balearica]TDO97895.1 PD-(D/E)XK nuclease superfamily protein [Marinomonas balearica]
MHKKLDEFLHIPKILRDKYQLDESFNLFKVLRGSSDEVRLHSRFLAELLDPQGSHGLGPEYLIHFVGEVLRLDGFDCESAFVLKEWNDIDILIRNKNGQAIILENKIYAHDQENQLHRYYQIVNDLSYEDKNIHIVYLTLDGKKASNQSLNGIPDEILSESYTDISYKFDISKWLKLCRKEAVEKPELRESITQYLNLVSELTHTNQSASFMKELESWFEKELINGRPVGMLDALLIAKEKYHAKRIEVFREAIFERISGLSFNQNESTVTLSDCEDFVAKNDSFDIWVYPIAGEERLQVGFINNHGACYFSVWCSQKGDKTIYDAARNAINTSNFSSYNKSNQWSAGWKYLSDPIVLSASTDENLQKLSDNNYLNSLADTVAQELKAIVLALNKDSMLKSLF